MEDDYGSNIHAGLEKSVHFMEYPLWRGFVIRDFCNMLSNCMMSKTPAITKIFRYAEHTDTSNT